MQGVKKIIVQHPAYLWPFFKVPSEKLMPHSQISLKYWLNYVGSKLHFLSLQINTMMA